MRLLIGLVKDGIAQIYHGPEPKTDKLKRDEEAQFLELKIASKSKIASKIASKFMNPRISENLEYWKNLVEEKKYYGLFVLIDYDRAMIEYLPIPTKQDMKKLLRR